AHLENGAYPIERNKEHPAAALRTVCLSSSLLRAADSISPAIAFWTVLGAPSLRMPAATFLPQVSEKAGRRQFYMGLQGRPERERSRFAREVPQAKEVPVIAPNIRHFQLVAGDVEGRSLPAIGGLHFD